MVATYPWSPSLQPRSAFIRFPSYLEWLTVYLMVADYRSKLRAQLPRSRRVGASGLTRSSHCPRRASLAAGIRSPSLQPFFNSIAVTPAGFEFLAVGETKQKLAVVQRNEFSDSGSLHDGRAVNPQKTRRVQLRLYPVHRLSQQVTSVSDMKSYIVAASLNPINIVD